MRHRGPLLAGLAGTLAVLTLAVSDRAQEPAPARPRDPVAEAQRAPVADRAERPERRKSEHDRSDIFNPVNDPAASKAFDDQPERGRIEGFDFARDPLDSKRPLQSPEEIMKADMAGRARIDETQQRLLASRYDLRPRLDPEAKMSRGKPLAVGPTARLAQGMTWQRLAATSPEDIRKAGAFPYPALPHPKQTPGGMVFPQVEVAAFPRLQRTDVDFDIPEAFLPEFPPAIYLQDHPELGDVSRGEIVTIANFYRLFKDILTPAQMDGMRLLLLPMPQEEFNATDDRKTAEASLGVACLDCHINGHTTGQIELSPDFRPQQRRPRLDTPSIRGVYAQQILGSKRSIRSPRDFAMFEQRTAYFNGDPIHAAKKGVIEISPEQGAHMERAQMMFDFPPAPKLDTVTGRLIASKATEAERRGEELFFGKAACATCHPAPFYMDQQMHDLHLERFVAEPGDGPIKAFTLRGIKDSPPYLHDGRCFTLEDTVEFFNLVQGLKLDDREKADLVAFLRQL